MRLRTVVLAALLHLGQAAADGDYGVDDDDVDDMGGDGFTRRVFFDDFAQPAGSLPSADRWTIDLGHSYPGGPPNWGTGERQRYTADARNLGVTAAGTLRITPRRAANGSWTSARIETTAAWDMGCAVGERTRVEARIRLGADAPARQLGIWPAFWALGAAFRGHHWNWPGVGEVDIVEGINGAPRSWGVVHCGTSPGGPCNEPSGISHIVEGLSRGAWHTYAWEVDRRRRAAPRRPRSGGGGGGQAAAWHGERARLIVDGRVRWTLRPARLGNASAWEAVAGSKKMLLLNVAVGGGFPDAVANMTTPTNATAGGLGASMEVDYVAAYKTYKHAGGYAGGYADARPDGHDEM